jgi:hypothetical protein
MELIFSMASHHFEAWRDLQNLLSLTRSFGNAYFAHVPKVLNIKSLMLKVAKVFFLVIIIWEYVVVINHNV